MAHRRSALIQISRRLHPNGRRLAMNSVRNCKPAKNLISLFFTQSLAKRQKMEHSPEGKYGENIYYSSGQQVTPDMPAKMWYDEIAKYDFAKAQFNPYTGHFTQLIWRDTKQVGVAYATS